MGVWQRLQEVRKPKQLFPHWGHGQSGSLGRLQRVTRRRENCVQEARAAAHVPAVVATAAASMTAAVAAVAAAVAAPVTVTVTVAVALTVAVAVAVRAATIVVSHG